VLGDALPCTVGARDQGRIHMSIGLIGRKVGMTQIFQTDGTMIPVSVVAVEPNTVTRLRTTERDGYTAVQLGIEESSKLTKPELGQLKSLPKVGVIREFRLEGKDDTEYTVGQKLDVTLFAAGDIVDVTGVSKGKGFSGHIKRHHFKRGPKTHGSDHHRAPGSIGPGTTPGRVYKGMRMAGHMGDERATVKKLRVVRADAERNLLLVKGSVPGAPNALILVKKA
jgi:large subunit ribosomal protein L3